jgi:4-hydroxyphenylacetate 3-monooxygenase
MSCGASTRSSRSAIDEALRTGLLLVVKERDDGIVVRGAKMVGTAALFGDEIFVGTIEPLGPQDDDYALTFSIPSTRRA